MDSFAIHDRGLHHKIPDLASYSRRTWVGSLKHVLLRVHPTRLEADDGANVVTPLPLKNLLSMDTPFNTPKIPLDNLTKGYYIKYVNDKHEVFLWLFSSSGK